MEKQTIKSIGFALIAATLITLVVFSKVLFNLDSALNDAIYQQPVPPQRNVLVIGIDAQSIEDLGPFPWKRDVMGALVETLNSNPDAKPAVIGIDVLFTGESEYPEADAYLVEAVKNGGNVVLAAEGHFASALVVENDGDFYMDDYYVERFDQPFTALDEVATIGHINGMYDIDGVLRHSILQIDLPDGRQIPSFALEIYNRYCEYYSLDKGVLPKTNSRHQWYLPFSATPGTYSDGFSVSKILSGEIPADLFAGSIVLIGPYATGLKDHFITAIDHAQNMYGVEFQANTIDALIAQNFKVEVSDALQYTFLFILSALCFLFFWGRKVLVSTLTWLLLCGGWLGICYVAYDMGYVLHSLWIPLAVTVLYITTVAINYVNAAMEKLRVTNTFKKYVAPEIVTEILKEGADSLGLSGKLTDIAVLFVDIRGFTPISEVLSPPQVVEILNKYLTLTSFSIIKNSGTLDKFIGDATMAFWGAPLPQEDIIFKAVSAAWEMVEASEVLGKELMEQFGRTVTFGIGVHYGPAVVGNIGAEMRMDFTAIGDTVNTAARLESHAPPGKILISKIVADALEGRILTTSLGSSIKLKGKSDSFEVFTMDGIVAKTDNTAVDLKQEQPTNPF